MNTPPNLPRLAEFEASALRRHGQAGSLAVRIGLSLEIAVRIIITLAVAFVALSIAACNTIAGMGQDASAAGHAVTDTANGAK